MTNETLIKELRFTSDEIVRIFSSAKHEDLFVSRNGKWSAAEHMIHLISSMRETRKAYTVPGFLLKWIFGKPDRPAWSYVQTVQEYEVKLKAGAKASGRYIPKADLYKGSEEIILKQWSSIYDEFLRIYLIREPQMDYTAHRIPHPILGKISLQELAYFTLYHNQHHLRLMKDCLQN